MNGEGETAAQAPIDAVILWVDGADPRHAEKLARFLGSEPKQRSGAEPTRFHHAGELDYCLTSLLRFAPWLRRIHIVTDEQTPAILDRLGRCGFGDKFRLVDHREIFRGMEQHLPTFNSNSISTVLHRIDGLADQFIYLNDDFALLRSVTPDDFFRDGHSVLRGRWRPFHEHRWHKRLADRLSAWVRRGRPQRFSYLRGQQASARLAGFDANYFQIGHTPHPWRASALAEFFARQPEAMERNLRSRVRDPEQFVIEALAAHLALASKRAVIDNRLRVLHLNPARYGLRRLQSVLACTDDDPQTAFLCVQSLDQASAPVCEGLLAWLDQRIGNPEMLAQAGLTRATSP
jgi:hypothetical protein